MQKYCSELPHGLMFHYFHDELNNAYDQGSLSGEEFERILEFVGLENIVSPEDWIFKAGHSILKKTDVCITFDDGLKCQYDICLPILEKYGIRCFWFIYSSVFEGEVGKLDVYRCFRSRCFDSIDDFYNLFFRVIEGAGLGILDKDLYQRYLENRKAMFPFYSDNDLKFRFLRDEVLERREYEYIMDSIIENKGTSIDMISEDLWLTDEDLKDLSQKGHLIGLHSYDHPTDIAKLSRSEQIDQYQKNYRHIKRVCKKEVVSMSHPCNSYNEDTIRILEGLGILCGFRSNMSLAGLTGNWAGSFEIPREDATNIIRMI
jgi:peptidoglycan/xylan/chitin deacetylase (PgdA/CDA1 family)